MNIPSAAHQVVLRSIPALAALLMLAACRTAPAPGAEAATQSPSGVDAVVGVNRIAIIDRGGTVYTIDPDGANRIDLNASGVIPEAAIVWSPDGSRLAFSLVVDDGSQLVTIDPRGEMRTTIHRDARSAVPFYLYWSPDSQHVAFLNTTTQGQMALQLAQAAQPESGEVIARGQPNYFSWSPEGKRMVVHIGGSQGYVGTYRLGDVETQNRDAAPAVFQAPAWSPTGDAYLFARAGRTSNDDLVLVRDGVETVVAEYEGGITFAWSPDGRRIAHSVLDESRTQYADLTVVDVQGGEPRTLVTESHLAYFWSPDGERIAYLTARLSSPSAIEQASDPPDRSTGKLAAPRIEQDDRVLELTWHVVDVESGETTALVSFVPTANFLFVVPFFDQFAQSITFWSPDSRYLLLAGAPLAQKSGIYRIDTMAESDRLTRVGSGEFAVWSWR